MGVARVVCVGLLIDIATSLRKGRAGQSSKGVVDTVACPVLASLVSAGHLKANSLGEVPKDMAIAALMQTGATPVFSAFQAAGIVGYMENDTHQEFRMTGPAWGHITDTKYVNLYTMNPHHGCSTKMGSTVEGYPCNVNVQFQQHGYSTTLMDQAHGWSARSRFHDWFGARGVLTKRCLFCEKELRVEGLRKLLERARREGDLSGENSLNASGGLSGSRLSKFHPSITSPAKYLPLAQWQAVLAWTGFWVAFSRERNGVSYIPESDLESMFLRGEFPKTWEKRTWGLGTMFNWIPGAFKGYGAGDEFVQSVEGLLAKVGTDADETTFYGTFAGVLAGWGAFNDQVNNQIS